MHAHTPSSKRIRVDATTETQPNTSVRQTSIEKVFDVPDYLSIICSYLTIKEMFGKLKLLSNYQNCWIDEKLPLSLLKDGLRQDFGNIIEYYDIKIDPYFAEESHGMFIRRFYVDWEFLDKCFRNVKGMCGTFTEGDDDPIRDFKPLFKLQKAACIQHWLHQVLLHSAAMYL